MQQIKKGYRYEVIGYRKCEKQKLFNEYFLPMTYDLLPLSY